MAVYFIRAIGGFGPVKIGHSALPARRLQSLMAYAPYPLEIVTTAPGSLTRERQFHTLFRDQHSHREWFHPSPALERTMEQVAMGAFDYDTLPAPGQMPSGLTRGTWPMLQREALSLNARVRSRCERHGFATPDDLHLDVGKYAAMPEAQRDELKARIEAYIKDPMGFATVINAPWAQRAFAAYLAQREAA